MGVCRDCPKLVPDLRTTIYSLCVFGHYLVRLVVVSRTRKSPRVARVSVSVVRSDGLFEYQFLIDNMSDCRYFKLTLSIISPMPVFCLF